MTHPITVVHRRNQIAQLKGLPQGCWIEIDVEIYQNKAYLTHDPITGQGDLPDLFEEFVPQALQNGVAGFVVDCKRECAEKWVEPVFQKLGITSYFYLNEMEVQADIFQSLSPSHNSGIRIWKYRRAPDVIQFATDMNAAGLAHPIWTWVDCWQRGLLEDIKQAYLPINGEEAVKLQANGVKLCICSPELYVHKYNTEYDEKTLEGFYEGIRIYRDKLRAEGIKPDSICSKFPHIWFE